MTLDDIRRSFDAGAFARGRAYADEDRVLHVGETSPGMVDATVRGSGGAIYGPSIVLRATSHRHGAEIEADCDCPVGVNCKHAVAALIALLRRRAPAHSDDPTLSPALATWIAALRRADVPTQPEPNSYPDTVKDRLIYVVQTSGPRLSVTPMKARLRKDGTLAKNPRPYDTSRLAWSSPAQFVLPVDRRIVRRLVDLDGLHNAYRAWNDDDTPGAAMETLEMIAATGRGRLNTVDGPVLAIGSACGGHFVWREHDDGTQRIGLLSADDRALDLLPVEPCAYADPATGAVGPLSLHVPAPLARVLGNAPFVPPEAVAEVTRAMGALKTAQPPVPRPTRTEVRNGVAVPVLRLFEMTARDSLWGRHDTVDIPVLRLSFDYAGREVTGTERDDLRFREGDRLIVLRRERSAEDAACQRLGAAGALPIEDLELEPSDDHALDFSFADWDSDDRDALSFTAEVLPQLRADGWRIEIDQTWPYRLHEGPVEIRAGVTQGDDGWFSVGLTLEADGQTLDLAPLIVSIIGALPIDPDGALADGFDIEEFLEDIVLWQRLPDGRHVPIEAATVAPLVTAFLTTHRLFQTAHEAEAGAMAELAEALNGCGVPFSGGANLIALGDKLRALAEMPMAEPPPELTATLRPYQKTGFGWLRALSETGFGGMLADDMGLGKTVQALALLVARHLAEICDRPSLLIAPTSLVGVWRAEAERFAPDLRVLTLQGPQRHTDRARIPESDLVISTYPLLHRDHDMLCAQPWDMIILDEAQAVKNPATAAAKQIRNLSSRSRLALTGTPLENSLEDLWALFDWLIPGLLGDRKGFRKRFRMPIERDADPRAQSLLNARIKPFILRRTKSEVVTELPAKTEITDLVTLGERQRGLYETIRVAMDRRVQDAIAARGLAASRITILDALLKLRQVCCDPALLKDEAAAKVGSAKRTRLLELLDELVAEGRRVLVFSQFVAMLRLIEADVKARDWDYAWLTGNTKNRDAVVAGFQNGAAPVFLISLKAGGVGLNLTAADTVIIADPWWNPAVERQAMDRAHRIGQDRAVFVHRLVAEGTVEQRIAVMQAKKQAMADALFDGGGDPLALAADDLAALLKPMDAE